MIHSAGGISILAHPHKLENISIVLGVIELGVKGLEVYCPKSSTYAVSLFEQVAEEHDLLLTGGSDFHGEPEEIRDFGRFSVPLEIWEKFSYYNKERNNEKIRYL